MDAAKGPTSDAGSVDVGSENATGFGTIPGDDEPLQDQLSDVSDTGWDTDLEIEGSQLEPHMETVVGVVNISTSQARILCYCTMLLSVNAIQCPLAEKELDKSC